MKKSLQSATSPEELKHRERIAHWVRLYRQLPLETVARHEAGHAVMAHRCGGYIKSIVFGRMASGDPFGQSIWSGLSIDKHPLVISGGVLALYLHDRPSDATFEGFCNWATFDGFLMAVSAGGDWSMILRLTGQPKSRGLKDDLERAVRPYFDQAIALLAKDPAQLDRLTELLMTQPPGIGHLTLKRFFSGRPRRRWVERLERPRVLWTTQTLLRERRSATTAPPYADKRGTAITDENFSG